MLVGQNLGPFAIQKELGAGAMGAVYLGVYEKTGQKLAIKVMAPGMGSGDGAARFEREAAILKQLRHPNIVRLFGVGKYRGTRYYAMEFIEGETLDRVLSRRGRLTWEEVVDLGSQLCAALQHAHQAGVVHRDLKPSNLMVLRDGTLKLTDFGIAKDLDVTALTGANCTVGTAAYMSPEQCRGERDISHKSDLYSLGVVLYELVTGQKPFTAQNAMEMFILHDRGTFERPQRRELNIPIWLDNLICQLLEKKPDQRPLDAAMVGDALLHIKDKVEAQASAGAEAARGRIADRMPAAHRITADATDKEAARTLLGKKKRKVKKGPPFYRQAWFVGVAALAVLLAFGGVLALLFRPASPDTLYRRAEKLMQKDTPDDWDTAYNGPISEYLRNYGDVDGEQTAKIRQWKDQIEQAECARLVSRYVERKRDKKMPPNANTDAETKAFDAAWAEEEGHARAAWEGWKALQQSDSTNRWGRYAAVRLVPYTEGEQVFAKAEGWLDTLRRGGEEPAPTGLDADVFLGLRYERFGDLPRALERFEAIKADAVKNPAVRGLGLVASARAQKLQEDPTALRKFDEAQRKANVVEKLARARLAQTLSRDKDRQAIDDARADCMSILALYAKEPGFEELLAAAKSVWEDLEKKLRGA